MQASPSSHTAPFTTSDSTQEPSTQELVTQLLDGVHTTSSQEQEEPSPFRTSQSSKH